MMPSDFSGRLSQGAFWEAWVGAVLSRCGLTTVHHPAVIGGERDHSLSHDLTIFNNLGTFASESCLTRKRFREGMKRGGSAEDASPSVPGTTELEVKSSSLTFTSPNDYPMPTALVCAQDSWMNKWPGKETVQRDFLLVSRVTGHLVWVPKGTLVQMNHPVHDRNRNYSYKCVVVDKEQLRPFKDFVKHVKAQ